MERAESSVVLNEEMYLTTSQQPNIHNSIRHQPLFSSTCSLSLSLSQLRKKFIPLASYSRSLFILLGNFSIHISHYHLYQILRFGLWSSVKDTTHYDSIVNLNTGKVVFNRRSFEISAVI